jgi:type I restriction enzyme M protein
MIDFIATIGLTAASEGEKTHRPVDLLGRVYEYFLTRFASAEGKNGGQWSGTTWTAIGRPKGWRGGVNQFYTPSCVVRCLVEMLAPYKGRIYDPACDSGGMFMRSRNASAEAAERGLSMVEVELLKQNDLVISCTFRPFY